MGNDQGSHNGENYVKNQDQSEATFGFPILDIVMKNIPPFSLPQFHVLTEDPNTFLFEFDILCRIYNYNQDGHKLK